ncbi:hypothetical protein GQ53DRAFT_667097 [Thozetella sp. PMI_491]|nr:hypothetical protein GQ53DRAFT_667097 [Thozetella sp. PMI_491]
MGKDCVRVHRRATPLAGNREVLGSQEQSAASRTPAWTSSPDQSGRVVVNGDQRRYIEDNKLWASIGDELQANENHPSYGCGQLGESPFRSGVEFGLFRRRVDSLDILHPSIAQALALWQVFLNNVHPLTKLLHGPLVQERLVSALSGASTTLPRSTEALMFAIYLMAVVSLDDQECQNLLGEPRQKHLIKYCQAIEEALNRAEFLGSMDLEVLQAFTLYLMAVRHLSDQNVLWLLTGLASRMGQRMGLHRERSLRDLSLFDAEIRRRLWWQIMILDGRAAQLTGASMDFDNHLVGDCKKPANVSDADLSPSMGTPIPTLSGSTDMVFCSARYEIGEWLVKHRSVLAVSPPEDTKKRLLSSIDDLEQCLEERYLRGIDTAIPLNLLTNYLARSAVCQMRLSAHNPIRRPRRGLDLDHEQMKLLFDHSLDVIRYDILCHSTEALHGFLWHVDKFFPFDAFVILVTMTPICTTLQTLHDAWDIIEQVYQSHPCFFEDTADPLYAAIGSLTLKSWNKALSAFNRSDQEVLIEPLCVTKIRKQNISHKPAIPMESTPPPSTGSTPREIYQKEAQRLGQTDQGSPDSVSGNLPRVVDGYRLAEGEATREATGWIHNEDMDWNFWGELLKGNGDEGKESHDGYAFPLFADPDTRPQD